MDTFLKKLFRLGNWQAVCIILTSGILDAYALARLEPTSVLALAAFLYSAFGFTVLIVKLREWIPALNRRIRKQLPKYDRFCTLREESLRNRGTLAKIIYFGLRFLTIACGIAMLIQGQYGNFMLCVLTLLLFTLPSLVQQNFSIQLPTTLETIIYCFIFAAQILGEINNFYRLIPGWDTMLHTLNGFLCAAIGFALVDMLNQNSKSIQLSPPYLALTAFCFSMTVGVIWEFIEFSADQLLSVDMQKDTIIRTVKSILINSSGENTPVILRDISDTVVHYGSGESFVIQCGYLDIGIFDTIKDLFVNFLGATVFSFFGFFYVKRRDDAKGGFAERFIPVVKER